LEAKGTKGTKGTIEAMPLAAFINEGSCRDANCNNMTGMLVWILGVWVLCIISREKKIREGKGRQGKSEERSSQRG
jgi:hypothetical protein